MLRSALSSAGALALAAALGCSGDGRPPSLVGGTIDASFAEVPASSIVGGGGGLVGGGGGGGRPGSAPSGDAAVSFGCRSTAILVVDRSGSMRDNTLDGTRKWSALLAALESVLPRIDGNVALGLVMFPRPGAGGSVSACAPGTTLDLEPRLGASADILARLRANPPDGPTPTAGAVDVAGGWFVTHPGAEGERYLILATDGAPNCNAELSPLTCTCAGAGASCRSSASGSINCLDDARTVAAIDGFRRQDVFTYVVGLNGAEAFSGVLDAMADAGGRPRAAAPRFYPANTAGDLAREFSAVTSVIANNCP